MTYLESIGYDTNTGRYTPLYAADADTDDAYASGYDDATADKPPQQNDPEYMAGYTAGIQSGFRQFCSDFDEF